MPAMLVPTLVMGVLAAALLAVGAARGQGQHLTGLKAAGKMTVSVLPLLAFAFVLAGMVQVLLPREAVARWIGAESGLRGILVGTVAGAVTPGGPYVTLPVVCGLREAGAGAGTLVAFLTAWSLWAVARLPMEIGILGWKLTLLRLGSVAVFPPVAGLLAEGISRGLRLQP